VKRAAAVVALSLVLSGCAKASPEADLQTKVNDLVSAANAGDAAAVRTAGGRLLEEIRSQSAAGDITTVKADRLGIYVRRIMANAGLLEQSDEPSPSASPSAEPSPSPSPEPSPTEAPSPSPQPSPTEAPPSPDVLPSVQVSGAAFQQSPQPSPAA
jgi:hypothetical protein